MSYAMDEIDRLSRIIERKNKKMRTLIEMLRAVGVDVWLDPDGEITVVNQILEAPHPIGLGAGYMGLGAGGT